MQKRALGDQVLIYILSAIILGGIALFGWKMISSTSQSACRSESTDFALKLKEISRLPNGAVQEFSLVLPCNAHKLLMFDSTSPPNSALFSEYPIIRDSLQSNIKTNVFVLNDKLVVDSYTIEYVQIKDPFMLCLSSTKGKADIKAVGEGNSVILEPLNEQQNCIEEFS